MFSDRLPVWYVAALTRGMLFSLCVVVSLLYTLGMMHELGILFVDPTTYSLPTWWTEFLSWFIDFDAALSSWVAERFELAILAAIAVVVIGFGLLLLDVRLRETQELSRF